MSKEHTSPPNDLARLLMEIRENHRWSATKLADRIGCHRSLLYRWLSGKCIPRKEEHLQSIARICERNIDSIRKLVSQTSPTCDLRRFRSRICRALQQLQAPTELPSLLRALAEEVFQADEIALFLTGISTPLPCMWCAGTYPAEGSQNAGKIIPLYEYIVDWSTFVPRQQDDLIVQAIATRQSQELADARFLQRMGMIASWCLIAPLVFEEQSIGCLIFHSSTRTYLTPEEKPLLECVCGCLTEALVDHQAVFEHEGIDQAFRPVIDLYIQRGFFGKGTKDGKGFKDGPEYSV